MIRCDAMHWCQTSYLCYSIVKMMFEINFHVNKCHLGFSCFPIIGVSMPAFFHVIPQNSKNENRMEKKHKSKLNIEHTHAIFYRIVLIDSIYTASHLLHGYLVPITRQTIHHFTSFNRYNALLHSLPPPPSSKCTRKRHFGWRDRKLCG